MEKGGKPAAVSPVTRLLIWAVTGWRTIVSPLYRGWNVCRYTPTCSQYALTALHRYGWRRGGWLAICRIARCNPFYGGGYDPVPPGILEVES